MKETVILAKKGNKDAFSNLIDSVKMDLYKIAKTRLHREDDILDAIQDTIVCAYKFIGNLNKPENFKKWIIKILVNKCNDIYNKRKNNQISIEDINEEVYSFVPEEFDDMQMKDILRNLKDDEKLIITLYYLEDYTSKEISKLLGMNENTIKTKISRAKDKIKNNFIGGRYNG